MRDGDEWVISGEKTWNTGVHTASHDLIFARTSGTPGSGAGITAFLVPADAASFTIEEHLWTFNTPIDHAHVCARRRSWQPARLATPPTAPCRCTLAWATQRHQPFGARIYRHHRRYRHHRGRRGDPDAAGGGLHVRLHEAAGSQGRARDARRPKRSLTEHHRSNSTLKSFCMLTTVQPRSLALTRAFSEPAS